jgi:hypothetical protein
VVTAHVRTRANISDLGEQPQTANGLPCSCVHKATNQDNDGTESV